MIGDIILIGLEHKKKAKNIYNKFISLYRKGARYVITIGGESGVGKTEIALILRDLFYDNNIKGEIISIDDYYCTRWSERNKIRKITGTIGKKEIDWNKLQGVINTFRSDFYNNMIIQRINKFTDSIEKAILNRESINVLIIEGLYSLYLHKDSDFNVYLDGTYKDTTEFRIKRNKEPQNDFRYKVLQREHLDIIKSKKYADLIL